MSNAEYLAISAVLTRSGRTIWLDAGEITELVINVTDASGANPVGATYAVSLAGPDAPGSWTPATSAIAYPGGLVVVIALVGGSGLLPDAGEYTVWVRVTAGGLVEIAPAGVITIQPSELTFLDGGLVGSVPSFIFDGGATPTAIGTITFDGGMAA